MKRTRRKLSSQIKRHATKKETRKEVRRSKQKIITTGSTLLDLAISGGCFNEGGIPSGLLVEIFGPPACGKTVLLCELAGCVQREGGEVMFFDPEARLNKAFAHFFGLQTDHMTYTIPDTVASVFKPVRDKEWIEAPVHGVFADSLAALSTVMELEDKDQYGMRRAKEFSEELRKTCRILQKNNLLMVCSNQVRENLDAGAYGQRYRSPGGQAIGFYSSLRLRCSSAQKMRKKTKIKGKEHTRVIGVETEIEIFKSSICKPYRRAPVFILFDYGIDDIRANLQYIKTHKKRPVYTVGRHRLTNSLDQSITMVEHGGLEGQLRQEVIELWNEIEEQFSQERKPKR